MKIAMLLMILSFPIGLHANSKYKETRYCDEDKRSAKVVRAFKQIHPCPETGKSKGPCPNWSIDHVIPLGVGGCDSVSNLQWLPNEIKTCAGDVCKDRWEREVYKRRDLTK